MFSFQNLLNRVQKFLSIPSYWEINSMLAKRLIPMFFLRIMYYMPFAKGSWSNYVIQLNKHVYLRVMRQDSWYSDNGRHLNNHIWCSSSYRGGRAGDTDVQKHRFFTNLFWMISISSSLLWCLFFTPFWQINSFKILRRNTALFSRVYKKLYIYDCSSSLIICWAYIFAISLQECLSVPVLSLRFLFCAHFLVPVISFRFFLDFSRIFSTITITRAVARTGKWGSSDITSDEHFGTTF